jgi:hypothetical protein
MTSKRTLSCALAALTLGCLAALAGGINPAGARDPYADDYQDNSDDPSGHAPLLAVVGLKEQRVSIYDASGKILESPVSSGQGGLETPPGIFSVVQKEEDHHSNLFDDASMPFMERITWTGIALHAGVLPGYPASHGCVRMPEGFAEKLYGMTKLGMRVVIVREDIAPAEIAEPVMFTPAVPQPDGDPLDRIRAAARRKFGEAEEAVHRFKEAKLAAAKRANEAAQAQKSLHAAEANLAEAEGAVKAAEHAAETAGSPERTAQAEAQKSQALAKVEAARTKLEAAKLEAQTKAEAAARAEEESKAATVATAIAHDASEEAEQNLSPVSVFISRKTQRLYVRKKNMPVFEAPVTIRDADKPMGSFVFTALDRPGGTGPMRWNVVSMYKNAVNPEPAAPAEKGKGKVSHSPAAPADAAAAQAALGRITVTEETRERISAAVLPGSSLIISDEGFHRETGKDTDFIVVMSGEPMGGLTSRHHPSAGRDEYFGDGFFGMFSSSRRSSGSGRSSRGGGGFSFFGD